MTRSLSLILVASCALCACDKKETVKQDMPPSTAQVDQAHLDKNTYLFHWQAEGDLNGSERTLRTTLYALEGESTRRLGDVPDVILVGHDAGVSAVRRQTDEVWGCGACDESDPVATCAKGPEHQVKLPHERLLVTLPGGEVREHAHLAVPSLEEALARHVPGIEYRGQAGRLLFVTYSLEQMPCGADGEYLMEEHVVIDMQSGARVEPFNASQIAQAGEEVMVAAIGQANAMYEGFDGTLKLEAVQYTLDGSTPNALYTFTGSCGEVCSGMVDVEQEVRLELPSAIVPSMLTELVTSPPKAVAVLLDEPNPARQAQGWSVANVSDATIQEWLVAR